MTIIFVVNFFTSFLHLPHVVAQSQQQLTSLYFTNSRIYKMSQLYRYPTRHSTQYDATL